MIHLDDEREEAGWRTVMKRVKSGKVDGSNDTCGEIYSCLGEKTVDFLTRLFNTILESESMSKEWRRSTEVMFFRSKGDIQNCSNYKRQQKQDVCGQGRHMES